MFWAFVWSGLHKFTTIARPIGSPPVASCLDDVLHSESARILRPSKHWEMRPKWSALSLGLGISWQLLGLTSRWGSTAPARTREVSHPVGSAERSRVGLCWHRDVLRYLLGSWARGWRITDRFAEGGSRLCRLWFSYRCTFIYKSNIGMHLEVKSVPSVYVLRTRPSHGMLLFLFGRVSQDFALIQTLAMPRTPSLPSPGGARSWLLQAPTKNFASTTRPGAWAWDVWRDFWFTVGCCGTGFFFLMMPSSINL